MPDVRVKRIDLLKAAAAGRDAAQAGRPKTHCPHDASTPEGRALAAMWQIAYEQEKKK